LETSYLEETKDFGNVFTGWDSYLSNEKTKIKKSIHYEDRYFSLSSVTSPASRREELKKVSDVPRSSSFASFFPFSRRNQRKMIKVMVRKERKSRQKIIIMLIIILWKTKE
jgi:hypothetical protein